MTRGGEEPPRLRPLSFDIVATPELRPRIIDERGVHLGASLCDGVDLHGVDAG